MTSFMRNFLAGLSKRERRMLAAMLVVAMLLVCSLSAFFIQRSIDDLESKSEEWSELLRLVVTMEPQFRANQLKDNRLKNLGKPKPLRTLVDNVVEKIGLDEPDTKELNDKNHPGGWLERSVEVSFRTIGFEGFVEFMEKVEQNRREFPIAISKLDVRKSRRQDGDYRVEMTIATYEKADLPEEDRTRKTVSRGGRK